MVRATVEVSSGAACFRALVRAESILRALRIAQRLYPGAEARVVFPIEPETFFAGALEEMVELEMPSSVAG